MSRGRYTRPTGATRKRVLERDDHQCQRCHRRFAPADLEVDHVVALDDGGSNRDDNLQALCRPCHARKTHRRRGPLWFGLTLVVACVLGLLYGDWLSVVVLVAALLAWLAHLERKHAGRPKPIADDAPAVVVEEPKLVIPPATNRPKGNGNDRAIPIALTSDGKTITWDMARFPHSLITGETGGGKTSAIRTVIDGCLEAGCRVAISDPKRLEFLGYRDQGLRVETTSEGIADLIEATHAEMMRRTTLAEQDGREPEDVIAGFDRLVLVTDEFSHMGHILNTLWREETGKTAKSATHPSVELAQDIARLGRTVKVHIVVGMQRPDQTYLGGGDFRGNLRGLRISAGRLDREGALMMWGDASIGLDLPDDAPGLGYVAAGRMAPVLARVLWTERPRRARAKAVA